MELNREQIIKDLECCSGEDKNCDECSLVHKPTNRLCNMDLMADALSIIKELSEENERLKPSKIVVVRQSRNYGKQYELVTKIKMISDEVKAVTVKEIQTKVAMHFGTYTDNDTVKVVDVFKLLAQIEKEVLEGDK